MHKFFIKLGFIVISLSIFSHALADSIPKNDEEKRQITIWVRAFGQEAAQKIVPYVHELFNQLSPYFRMNILVATKPNDLVAQMINESHVSVELVYADLNSISGGLNALIQATPENATVLSVSLGAKIKSYHVVHALNWLDEGAWAHGWKITNMNNDGGRPGHGWYNTAALYAPRCLNWMKTYPFPHWIDNGVEGEFVIDGQKIPIGNNEEVVLMARVIKMYSSAYFIHNVRDVVELEQQTGVGITFEAKLKRKVMASQYYLKNKLHMSEQEVWSHLWLICESGLIQATTSELLAS